MIKQIVIILTSCFLLSGCIQTLTLDEIGVINARGIDVNDEGKIHINLVIFQFEAQSTEITRRVSGQGATIKGAIDNANYETNYVLQPGKIQLDLYGKETAKQGISTYLDTLNRDPNTPDSFYMAVSDTTAEDILSLQEQGIAVNIGQYLHDVIDKNSSDHLFPKVTLEKFMTATMDIGRDPILPVFKVVGDEPKITSIAAFKGDKLVGEISMDNENLFKILEGRMREEWLEVSVPLDGLEGDLNIDAPKDDDELDLAFSIINNKGKSKLINKEALEFETEIKLDLNLLEKSIPNKFFLDNKKNIKRLEKAVAKKLIERYERLLEQLKELEVDPLGYGEVYRKHYREGRLTKQEWTEKIPDIQVDYKIDVSIISHGESV